MVNTRRVLNKGTAGEGGTDFFGANDTDLINNYHKGVDLSTTAPSDINTITRFRNDKLKIWNPGATYDYTFASSIIAANRRITLPLLTTDDTFTFDNHPTTLKNKTISHLDGNTFPDVQVNPEYRKVGGYMPGIATTGFGFCNGLILTTGTTSAGLGATDGKFFRFTTGTTVGNQASIKAQNGAGVLRAIEGRYKVKFKLFTTTNEYAYFGLQSNTGGTLVSGADPLNAISGVMLAARPPTDTTFKIARNDGVDVTVFTDTGIPIDGVWHTFEVKADTANTKFTWTIDNTTTGDLSTDIPTSSTGLYGTNVIETNETGVGKAFDCSWFILETSK